MDNTTKCHDSQERKHDSGVKGGSFGLDINKNNFSQGDKKGCPNSSFYVDFVDDSKEKYVRAKVRCKSWQCPYCARINAWVLKKRVEQAVVGLYGEMVDLGIDPMHCFKFLTLTAPGAGYRAANSALECEKQMKKAFKNLMGVLKRKYGNAIEFIWSCEGQKDGYPHLHVLLVGETIKPRSVKKTIEMAWRGRYGMGFVKLNSAFKEGLKSGEDFDRLIHYLTKYISKEMSTGAKGYRVFSMSRKARALSMLEKKDITVIEFGRVSTDDEGEEDFKKIWEAGDEFTLNIKAEMENAMIDELGTWFDVQAKVVSSGVQLTLPFLGDKPIDLMDWG